MNYTVPIRFEWDEGKSESCFLLRGFDFAYAAHAFADPDRLVRQDTRYSYGEDRYTLTGRIEGRLYVLAYTPGGGTIRIIFSPDQLPMSSWSGLKMMRIKFGASS